MNIAVLLAVFNRCETTIKGLSSLTKTFELSAHTFDVFMLDDDSPDGTAARVREEYPEINVVKGTGNLYWNRGMCAAFTASLKAGNYDAYLLFNDDVELFPETANAMIEEFVARNLTTPVIYVGSTLSTSTGQTTYSAFRETSRIKALGFHAIGAVSANTDCDTFNGNFVLVPGDFFRDIGGLDPIFHHGLGDIDLGLVAREAGIRSILYGTAVGTCEKGPEMRERLSRASFSQRLRLLFCAPNGVAPYRHFVWKHRPKLLFPLYLCVHVSKKLVSLFRSGAS